MHAQLYAAYADTNNKSMASQGKTRLLLSEIVGRTRPSCPMRALETEEKDLGFVTVEYEVMNAAPRPGKVYLCELHGFSLPELQQLMTVCERRVEEARRFNITQEVVQNGKQIIIRSFDRKLANRSKRGSGLPHIRLGPS